MSLQKFNLAIATVDQPLGQYVARQLAMRGQSIVDQLRIGQIRALHYRSHPFVTALGRCIDFPNNSNSCQLLPVDYNDMQSLQTAFRDVSVMICFPPMQSRDAVQWQQETERLFRAARQANVRACILLSIAGVNEYSCGAASSKDNQSLKAMAAVEKLCKDIWGKDQCILRICFGMQSLRCWLPELQADSKLRLPINQGLFPMVDLEDVIRVITRIIDPNAMNLVAAHKDQVYTLNGPVALNGESMAQSLEKASGRRIQFDGQVERSVIRQNLVQAARAMSSHGRFVWTEAFVDCLLEQCDLVREGRLAGGDGKDGNIPEMGRGNDVKKVGGIEPRAFELFAKQLAEDIEC